MGLEEQNLPLMRDKREPATSKKEKYRHGQALCQAPEQGNAVKKIRKSRSNLHPASWTSFPTVVSK
jgi:hypothetical protein